jgi:hypothetical protein
MVGNIEVHVMDVYCIHMAQDRVQGRAAVKTVMNRRLPLKLGTFLTSSVTISFSAPWS